MQNFAKQIKSSQGIPEFSSLGNQLPRLLKSNTEWLYIIDPRPKGIAQLTRVDPLKANAIGNQMTGEGGYEKYSHTKLQFGNIENIHQVAGNYLLLAAYLFQSRQLQQAFSGGKYFT